MNAQQYQKITDTLRKRPRVAQGVICANKVITHLYYLAYPLLVVWLLFSENSLAFPAIVCPMAGFVLVTPLRRAINRPRPYEAFQCAPIIPKDTKGKSFPSRHAYSSVAIAMTFGVWHVPAGIIMGIISCALIVLRVIGGVHYPSDVIAGAALGVAFGMLEMII